MGNLVLQQIREKAEPVFLPDLREFKKCGPVQAILLPPAPGQWLHAC
jgi:hypothetical protein